MCGRYTLLTPAQLTEIRELVQAAQRQAQVATGEIRPTDRVPVLVPEGGSLAVRPMIWGYPRPAGGGKTAGVVINARGETASTVRMWQDSFAQRRAIVPTTGFIEWNRQKGNKQPYLFCLPGQQALFLAALYQTFAVNGRPEERFSILTTAANSSVEDLHNRMPVVLLREEFEQWLHGDYAALVNRSKIRLERSAIEQPGAAAQLSFF